MQIPRLITTCVALLWCLTAGLHRTVIASESSPETDAEQMKRMDKFSEAGNDRYCNDRNKSGYDVSKDALRASDEFYYPKSSGTRFDTKHWTYFESLAVCAHHIETGSPCKSYHYGYAANKLFDAIRGPGDENPLKEYNKIEGEVIRACTASGGYKALSMTIVVDNVAACKFTVKRDGDWTDPNDPPPELRTRVVEAVDSPKKAETTDNKRICEYSLLVREGTYTVYADVYGHKTRSSLPVNISNDSEKVVQAQFPEPTNDSPADEIPRVAPTPPLPPAPAPPPTPPAPPAFFRINLSLHVGAILNSFDSPLVFLPSNPDELPVRRFGAAADEPIPFCGSTGRCVYRESDKLTDDFARLDGTFGATLDTVFVRDDQEIGGTFGLAVRPWGAFQWYAGLRLAATRKNLRFGLAPIVGATFYRSLPSGERVIFSESGHGAVEAAKGTVVEAFSGPQYGARLDLDYLIPGTPVTVGGRTLFFWNGQKNISFTVLPLSVGIHIDFLGDPQVSTPKNGASR